MTEAKSAIEIQRIKFSEEIKVNDAKDFDRKSPPVKIYGLPFEVIEIQQKKDSIIVSAITKNTGPDPIEVLSYKYTAFKSPLVLSINLPQKKASSPALPHHHPRLVRWTIPSMCEVLFKEKIDLTKYDFKSGTEAELTVHFALKQEYKSQEVKKIVLGKIQ